MFRKKYRTDNGWHFFLRLKFFDYFGQPLQDMLKALRADKAFQKLNNGKIKIAVDVDPLNML